MSFSVPVNVGVNQWLCEIVFREGVVVSVRWLMRERAPVSGCWKVCRAMCVEQCVEQGVEGRMYVFDILLCFVNMNR